MNEQIHPIKKYIPKKYERVQEFFELLQKAPPVSTATEAYVLLERSLESVEGKYFSYTASRLQGEFDTQIENTAVGTDLDKMRVEKIDHTLVSGERIVSVVYADKHYIFLGDNGAIEIQTGEMDINVSSNPHNMIFFEKKGSDGYGVW